MPSVVSIVGKSNTGKTTFMVKLIAELAGRGYRVATIKHSHHAIEFDQPKKDSWRHAQAGSITRAVSATNAVSITRNVAKEPKIDDVVRLLGEDYDIILTEGFSRGDAPKIEIHRKELGTLLEDAKKLIAVVTDEPLEKKVRQFRPDDVKGVADLLEEGFIKPNRERISLYVNGAPVPLTLFPRQIITNIVLAMASNLRGVDKIESLEIFYRKDNK